MKVTPKIKYPPKFIRLAAVAAILPVTMLGACKDSSPIKIGFIGGISGRSADISVASRNAVQLAIDEQNAVGGIDGRRLELLVRDNQGDPKIAGDMVRKLAKEDVAAIIGPNLSSIAGGMLPAINETGVVTISPTVSSLMFAGKDDPFFRMNSMTRQNASAYANRHFENGGRRVAAVYDLRNLSFTESWLTEFTTAFEKRGGEVVAKAPFDASAQLGYATVVNAMLESRPDALLLVSNGVDTAQLAQQIRKVDDDIKLIAAEWAASEQLIEMGGRAVEGIVILQTYDRASKAAGYVKFRDTYQARFQSSPGYSSIAAYDAATVLIAALKRQKDGQPLKQVLLSQGSVKGLQQDLEFDQYGDGWRRQFFVTVVNGKFAVQ